MACNRRHCLFTQLTIGSLLALIFIILAILWPSIYFNVLKNKMILANNSFSYDLWKETPLPIYLEIYLYHFNNSEEVFKNPDTVKPYFEEKGPYVFKEHHSKMNLTWNENGTVTFLQRRTWQFEQGLSNGDLSDKITNINVIAVTAAYFVRHHSYLVRMALNSALKLYGENVVITRTAKELLFDGYSDELLRIVKLLNISGLSLPFDKFGWFYGRNESEIYDGWWTIHTGADDLSRLGDMDLWNYDNKTDMYDGECAKVKGTTGELFPPRTNPRNITVFASDVCSYITLDEVGEKEIEGITGRLFGGLNTQFDNGVNYPPGACFCKSDSICAPAGTRNVSLCKFGAPAFVSYPHFYLADNYYLSKIDGLKPNATNDRFEMALEIETGIPLYVRAQLQINILTQRIPGIKEFDKLPNQTYLPVMWFRQEVLISEDLAKQAKLGMLLETVIAGVFYGLIALGVVLLSVAIFFLVKGRLRRSESQDVLVES